MAKTAFDTLDRYPQGRDVSVVDLVQRSIFLLLLRPDLNDVRTFHGGWADRHGVGLCLKRVA